MPQQKRESMGKEGHMKARDIDILVYIRDKEKIDLRNIYEDEEEEKREHIANLVINKKAVINWTDSRLKAENIKDLFERRQINMLDIKYVSVSDNIFRVLRNEVVSKHIKKK